MNKGNTCKHRLLAWMLVFAMVLTMAPSVAFATETTEPTEEEQIQETGTQIPAELKLLQERINALPTGEEYRAMTEEEQDAVYEEAADISDAYFALTEEEQAQIDMTVMEELFVVMNDDKTLYDTTGTVSFLNSGYPYGKQMNSSQITLVIETECAAESYQWQVSDSETGSFDEISGATDSTYTFTPTSGNWYRCVVDGTESKAVMAVKPGSDGRTWTKPYSSWYISNGSMAYMVSGTQFDAVGLYTKGGNDYMLCTSYARSWSMYSSDSASPAVGNTTQASLDALKVAFDPQDDYNIFFEADLADGQQAFSFGCDTMLGNSSTSGSYSDRAALNAMVKNGALQQVAMIGAQTVENAADTDPAFVIAPVDPASRFWIGYFGSRMTYAYNTSGGVATELIDGENVVTLVENTDSGMTMSWMNIPSGGTVKFRFSVGDVAHTGAVSGKVDYEKEMLTGLDPNTSYTITDGGGTTYTVITNENGEIPLSGTDQGGTSYDFTGQKITIAKTGSEDTPAEIEVSDRPDAPDKPSDLEDEGNTPTVDANIEIVELTTTSVTISPKQGQQYAYSTDGTNWMTLTSTNTDENGNYVIEGLSEGATIQIRTRVSATSDSPASQWSDPKEIELKSTVKASEAGWSGNYDGDTHSISVTVTSPTEGATITYSSTTGENYSASKPEFRDAGTYTVYYRVAADDYYPAYGSATVTIEPKEVALEWTNTELIYNGTMQVPVAIVKEESLCEGDTCSVIVSGAQKNKGSNYIACATAVSNPNYRLPSAPDKIQTTFTIAPKELGVNWSNTELTYNGTTQQPTAELEGVESEDICNVTVSGEEINAGTNYTATASIDNSNYKIKTEDAGTTFVINPKEITAEMISLDVEDNGYEFTNTPITPSVTVKDGSIALVKGEDRDYVLTGDTSKTAYGTYEITINGKGNYTGTPKVAWSINDPNAPTGEIVVKTNKWNSFLNDITFGHFFNKTQKVTVTAKDGENESGVDKLYYYVSETSFASADALSSVEWKEIENGGDFSIDPNAKVYVYVKITDKAGNAAYISTNGIVVYTDSVQDTKEISFTRTSNEDVAAKVTLNGNTVNKITNGATELVNGQDYTISEDGATITFKATYLQSLSAGTYTLTVSYNPGGETYVETADNDRPLDTTIVLTVFKTQGSVTDISDLSKTYDGTSVENPSFITTNDRGQNDSNVTVTYKVKGADDSTYTTDKPVNAGEYVVRVTVQADGDHIQVSGTAEFAILQKSIQAEDMAVKIEPESYEYDGRNKAPVVTVTDAARDCTLVEGTDYELSGDILKNVQSGENGYLITVTGKGNYKGSVEKNWSITRTLPVVEILPGAAAITYGQKLEDSQLTGGIVKTASGVEVPGTFTWTDGTIKPTVADSGVTAYELIFTPEDTANFDSFTCKVTLTVNPKQVTLSWYPTVFTYNGKPQKPEAKVTNLEEGDDVTVTVSGEQISANTREELDSENGGYTATAAALEGTAKDNYKLSDTGADNQKKFKIYPKKITAAMVNAVTTYTYTGNAIAPTIFVEDSVSGMDGQPVRKVLVSGSDYTLAGDISVNQVGGYAITVTGTGNYTGMVEVEYKITDSSAPTGTIAVSGHEWKDLLSGFSFELFYQARQLVTITAKDEGSGVDKIYYYLTSSGETVNQETLAALPDTKWTEISNGGSFTIDPDNKYVIYAKITDKSGNVTFLSSNGIVLDKNAPNVTGIERNKTYCSDVTFAVSDAIGLASVKLDNKEQGVGGSYTIEAAGERKSHTIVAEDAAGNRTVYIIAINADGEHSFEDWEVVTPATCEQKGIKSHKCSACGFVETEEIPARGHDYKADEDKDAHFVWTAEKDAEGIVTGYKATAYFICNHDSSHTEKAQGCIVLREITRQTTEQEEGIVTYKATATYKGKVYKATKKVTLAKLTKLEDPDAAANSNIYTSTSVADNAPATTIGDELNADLAKDLMTPSEEAIYKDSKVAMDITLYLEVQNITGAVDPEEAQKVEAQIADLVTEKVNTAAGVEIETGATYLDLSMYKNVKTEETTQEGETVGTSDDTTQITDTEAEITITVDIPDDIPPVEDGFTRTYSVVRVHQGNAQTLDTRQNGNQLTFCTSKFSTYAITYVDVKDVSPSKDISVSSIRITSDKNKMTKKGETAQLTAVIEPASATNKKITWSSSDATVATVDENGKVTAVGDGTAIITAKTANGKTATISITVKVGAESESGESDIKVDTSYRTLRLRVPTSTKTTNVLKWTKVSDADGYVIYGNKCNTKDKSYTLVKQVTIKDGSTTTWTDKNLASGTYYKYVVKAYKLVDGKKVWLAKSKVVHSTTTGGKYGNAKSVKVNKTAVSLAAGKTFAIKASMVKKDKTIKQHTAIKYESSNSKVATVNSKGVITAKGKGTCYIYVYAQNGMYQRVKVTVK